MTAPPVTRPAAFADTRDGRFGRGIAHRRRRTGRGEPVVLRDGSKVLIRQIQSTDVPLVADCFARLSPKSRRFRFLTAKPRLSQAELRYLTDIDHYDHEAIGAVDHADGSGVGIARYVRDAEDPQAAEIAVTVVDEWHRRGLGSELLAQLAHRARQRGIRRFTALVSAENVAAAAALRSISAELAGRESTTVEYKITLAPIGKALRAHSASAGNHGAAAGR